jgi:predicted DNA-binding WGR domain protein
MMGQILLEKTELTYVYGSSNKFYNVKIYENPISGVFQVIAEYGRIGNNPQTSQKYIGSNRSGAWNKYQAVIDSKTKKGYDKDRVVRGQDDLEELIRAYKQLVYDQTANGLVTYQQRMQLEALLESGDHESVNTAVKIIEAKREKSAA